MKPLSEKSKQIIVGGKYKHFKGGEYKVLSVARHSETLEELVVYQKQYDDNSVWVGPMDMFLENTKVDGKTVPRFLYLDK